MCAYVNFEYIYQHFWASSNHSTEFPQNTPKELKCIADTTCDCGFVAIKCGCVGASMASIFTLGIAGRHSESTPSSPKSSNTAFMYHTYP